MTIQRLADRPEYAAQTAALMVAVWPEHYGPSGRGDAAHDVARRIADDRAAIAVCDDLVVGTVALDADSFGARGDGPWLVGLCTAPPNRGQGIATALTTWVMGRARTQGHTELFTTVRDRMEIMKRLGWRRVRRVTDQSGSWSVWRVELDDR